MHTQIHHRRGQVVPAQPLRTNIGEFVRLSLETNVASAGNTGAIIIVESSCIEFDAILEAYSI